MKRFQFRLVLIVVLGVNLAKSEGIGNEALKKIKRQAGLASTVIHSKETENAVRSQFASHPIHAQLFQQQQPEVGIIVPTPPATSAAPPAPSTVNIHPAFLIPTVPTLQRIVQPVQVAQVPLRPIRTGLVPPQSPTSTVELLPGGVYLPPNEVQTQEAVDQVAPAYLPPSRGQEGQVSPVAPAYLPPTEASPVQAPPPPRPAYLPPKEAQMPVVAPAYLPPPPAPAAILVPIGPVFPVRFVQAAAAPPPKKEQRPLSMFAVPPTLEDLQTWTAKKFERSDERKQAGSEERLSSAASQQVFNAGVPNGVAGEATKTRAVVAKNPVSTFAVAATADLAGAGTAATQAPPAEFAGSIGIEQRLAAIRALQETRQERGSGDGLDSKFPVQYFQSS